MRLPLAALFAIVAVPVLAATGPGQGGLKGSPGQSSDAAALGKGSVQMNVGGPDRVDATTPGNGNTVSLPVTAVAKGLQVVGGGNGSGSAGGEGPTSVAGNGGGGGVEDGGLSVTEEIYELSLIEEEEEVIDPSPELAVPVPVPVPAALPMLGLGLLALPFVARRRRR